jgi:hypothetical protein
VIPRSPHAPRCLVLHAANRLRPVRPTTTPSSRRPVCIIGWMRAAPCMHPPTRRSGGPEAGPLRTVRWTEATPPMEPDIIDRERGRRRCVCVGACQCGSWVDAVRHLPFSISTAPPGTAPAWGRHCWTVPPPACLHGRPPTDGRTDGSPELIVLGLGPRPSGLVKRLY